MKQINETTTDSEAEFSFQELFISRTDKKGIIVSGNDVFFRISGYREEEMIGKPHNIIRHGDMPACVFKIFWDLIQNEKIAIAYVKNRTKDGRYYWVLATVFPFEGGYLSIRFKPASELFNKIKQVYSETRKVEEKEGTAASQKFMIEWLNKNGFSSYEDFMLEALRVEIKIRDEKMIRRSSLPTASLYQKMLSELAGNLFESTQRLRVAEKIFGLLPTLKNHFGKHSVAIAETCEQLQTLSVNMSISSHKLGKEGGTLSVVASNFQNTTLEVLKSYEKFSKNSSDVAAKLTEIMTGILCTRVLVEMLSFYIGEILDVQATFGKNEKQTSSKILQIVHLFKMTKVLFSKNTLEQKTFFKVLSQFHKDTKNLQNLILRLDLIRTGGKLEGSRTPEIADIFQPFLQDMGHHLTEVGTPVNTLQEILNDFCQEFEKIMDEMTYVEFGMEEGMHTLATVRGSQPQGSESGLSEGI
jgi:PAS domain S-box-containing protein